mgnify:CR=1 FL=1
MLKSDLIQSTSSWPFVEIRKLLKDRKTLIEKKNTIPILSNVLIEAKNSIIKSLSETLSREFSVGFMKPNFFASNTLSISKKLVPARAPEPSGHSFKLSIMVRSVLCQNMH